MRSWMQVWVTLGCLFYLGAWSGCGSETTKSKAPICVVSDSVLDFGTVELESSRDLSLTIRNDGTGPLVGSTSAACGEFTVVDGPVQYNLDPGESIEVGVTFAPRFEGKRSCELSLGDACATVACSGLSIRPPDCELSPEVLDFGTVIPGAQEIRSLTVTNTGDEVLAGELSIGCSPFTLVTGPSFRLDPDEAKEFEIRFAPDSPGTYQCEIEVDNIACPPVPCTGTVAGVPDVPATVLVPKGNFLMGDASPCSDEHRVSLTRAFLIGKFEITYWEYLVALQWAKDNQHVSVEDGKVYDLLDGAHREIIDLSTTVKIRYERERFVVDLEDERKAMRDANWFGAAAYCDWLNLQQGHMRAYDHATWECNDGDPYGAAGYRLPTGAEWEFTAQYNDDRAYPWGSALPNCNFAAYSGCDFDGVVGQYPVAPVIKGQGLYDIAGAAWEWCNDPYECNLGTDDVIDPVGPAQNDFRVRRGGDFASPSPSLRCAAREFDEARYRETWYGTGFRIARTDLIQ